MMGTASLESNWPKSGRTRRRRWAARLLPSRSLMHSSRAHQATTNMAWCIPTSAQGTRQMA